jgi:hypothetical protein
LNIDGSPFFIFGVATHNHKRKKRKKKLLRIIEKKLGSGFEKLKKGSPKKEKDVSMQIFE